MNKQLSYIHKNNKINVIEIKQYVNYFDKFLGKVGG